MELKNQTSNNVATSFMRHTHSSAQHDSRTLQMHQLESHLTFRPNAQSSYATNPTLPQLNAGFRPIEMLQKSGVLQRSQILQRSNLLQGSELLQRSDVLKSLALAGNLRLGSSIKVNPKMTGRSLLDPAVNTLTLQQHYNQYDPRVKEVRFI